MMDQILWTKQDIEVTEILLRAFKELRAYCEEYGCKKCILRGMCQDGQSGILFGKYRVTIERLD